ncbi:hypothetical protein PZH32_03870 [Adlercreutzia equolifaciens]|uniref:hypothetical protein n=1 Tax=Adlercreutzia equolifaciens TaxID=446660 RepID=UPI0023B0F9BA|nr:hypothetical protein [Adlercreutzia equolifaciens]MDE8702096.1 hypothetical protein [Adlercreutzia equolifaciens]
MLENGLEIETQLDAVDALDQLASTLRGLGFMCVALCDSPSVVDEDVFGLIADIAYYCAQTSEKASGAIYACGKSVDLAPDALRPSRSIAQNSIEVKEAA